MGGYAVTQKYLGRRRRPEKFLGSNGENKEIRFGNISAPQARENFWPKMDDEGGGVGGYAATQKYLGRCFRFGKYLVPYGSNRGCRVLAADNSFISAAEIGQNHSVRIVYTGELLN